MNITSIGLDSGTAADAEWRVARVVAGVDPNKPCEHAVRASWSLSKRLVQEPGSCSLALLHAVEFAPSLWPGLDESAVLSMNDEALAAATRAARIFVREALPEIREDELSQGLVCRPGSAADVLTQECRADSESLLVLGKHKERGFFEFGSTLRAVLALSEQPVWVQPHAPTEIRSILVAVDFSKHSARALKCALRLARDLDAVVDVVHILNLQLVAGANDAMFLEPAWPLRIEDVRKASRAELEAFMSLHDPERIVRSAEIIENTPVTGALDRAREAEADLLVLGTHGRSLFAQAILGSVANGVLRKAEIPVLVVPAPVTGWRRH